MKKYLLDTDTIIYYLNGNYAIAQKIKNIQIKNIAISFINLAELYYGAYKSLKVFQNIEKVKTIEKLFEQFNPSNKVVEKFGFIKSNLEKVG